MSKFKVGEIAVILQADQERWSVGLECEIVSSAFNYGGFPFYEVMIPGHPCPLTKKGEWTALERCLKKKKPPKGNKPFLIKANHGLFSGGWQFHKALRVRDEFFNPDTGEKIEHADSWAKVNL
jgi:hypothetical protein